MAWWPSWLKLRDCLRRTSARERRQRLQKVLRGIEALESRRVLTASSISVLDSSLVEGNSGNTNMVFAIIRSGDMNGAVTVGYQTSDFTAVAGSDYISQSATVTFSPGQSAASVSVPIIGDTFGEDNETFRLVLTGIVDSSGAAATLATPALSTTGASPNQVGTADFNNDGRLDVLVTNFSSSSFSIFRNTTTAGASAITFDTRIDVSTQINANGFAIGDINGDGRPDIAIANDTTSNVSVFLNTTTPGSTSITFASAVNFATGARPASLVFADLNHDGRTDLAVTSLQSNQLSVLFNTTAAGASTPTFAAQQTLTTLSSPVSIAAGDINGDGRQDLVAVSSTNNMASVFLNSTGINSTTAAFARTDFQTGASPVSVTLGDLNNDGRVDIATANSSANSVTVLLSTTLAGATTPSFAAAQNLSTGADPRSISLGDINGDGKLDLIVADRSAGDVSIHINRTASGATSATFDARQDVDAGTMTRAAAVGDLNGDGRADVLAVNEGSNNLAVFRNATLWNTSAPEFGISTRTAAAVANGISQADFNGDGKQDVVTSTGSNSLLVFLNSTLPGASQPSLGAGTSIALAATPVSVSVGDINLDGRPDLIVPNSAGNFAVLLNNTTAGASTPSFGASQTFGTSSEPFYAAIGDINGDGKPDVVLSNRGTNNVSVFLNTTVPGSATVTFAAAVTSSMTNRPHEVVLVDLNGDGRLDLAAVNQGTGYAAGSGTTISVRLNTTTAGSMTPTFAAKQDFTVGSAPRSITVLDVNGDGKPDLATANRQGNNVSILLNTTATNATSATFATRVDVAVTTGAEAFAVRSADIDGDGRADLVVGTRAGTHATILFNTTSAGASTASFGNATNVVVGAVAGLVVGDFNLDGHADIVSADASTAGLHLATARHVAITPPGQATGTIMNDDAVTVVSIARSTPAGSATNGNSVTYAVTFSRSVTGVDETDFAVTGPVSVANVMVTGSGSQWFVTLSGFTNDGDLGLNLVDDDTIIDVDNLPLGGTGANNGNFTGETYSIDHALPFITSVTSNTADGRYGPGSSIDVTVTFSEPVTLTGGLIVTLDTGVSVTIQPFVGQLSGSATYVISPGHSSADLNGIVSYVSGAAIQDLAGNDLVQNAGIPTVPLGESLAENKNLQIAPTREVSFAVASQTIDETGGQIRVVVSLLGVAATPITVPITVDGTAQAGLDYTGIPSNVIIPAGSSSAEIVIDLIDDSIAELTETIRLTMSQPVGVLLVSPSVHTVSVTDTERPTLAVSDASVVEGNSGTRTLVFTVTRTGTLDRALTFNYTTSNGTATAPGDYVAVSGAGFLAAGAVSTTISVTVNGDTTDEPDETVLLTITGINAVGTDTSFDTAQITTIGSGPQASAVADFNRDGRPDLVTVNSLGVNLSILLNQTTPGATTSAFSQQFISSPAAPEAVAMGDINGDGKTDIVVSNLAAGTVSVFLNTTPAGASTATFAAPVSFNVGTSPQHVALADLNRDGRLDIITANASSNTLSMLANSTAIGSTVASFAAAQSFSTGTQPTFITTADLNRDGVVDVIVANALSNTVSVFLNTTAAGATTFGFATRADIATGTTPTSVAAGDMNQDGIVDLIVANKDEGSVSWLRNTTAINATAASFAAKQDIAVGNSPVAVVLRDLNADGKLDIVATNSGAGTLSVRTNQTSPGSTTLSVAAVQTVTVSGGATDVSVADFNQDGQLDLASPGATMGVLAVALSNATILGIDPVTTSQSLAAPTTPAATIAVDLNLDGKPDLVVTNDLAGTLSIFGNVTGAGVPSATFLSRQDFTTGARPLAVAAGDINGDGRPDLAVVNYTNATVTILLNTTVPGATTFSFAAGQSFSIGNNPTDLVLADLNGDGRLDLAVTNFSTNVASVRLNTTAVGSTTASFASTQTFNTGAGPLALEAAEIDGDGLVDLVVANYTSGSVSILRNTTAPGASTPTFAAAQDSVVGAQPRDLEVADLNHDGKADIALALSGATAAAVLFNATVAGNSTIAFAPVATFALDAPPNAIAIADLDNDSNLDLATVSSNNRLTILRNEFIPGATQASFALTANHTTGSNPRSVALADLNGDGLLDLITANRSSNELTVLMRQPGVLGDAVGIGTIVNDDAIVIQAQFATAAQSVNEGTTTTTIIVTLSAPATSTVTIPFTINGASVAASGGDYTISASPLTILAGASSAAITVTVVNDSLDESNETLILNLGTPTNALLGTTTQHTLTILDDDPTPTVQFSTVAQTVGEAAGTVTIIVTLSAPSGILVAVPYTISGNALGSGIDYLLNPATTSPIGIPAGQTSASISITITDDTLNEASETVVFTMGTPTNATVGTNGVHTVTISDNDAFIVNGSTLSFLTTAGPDDLTITFTSAVTFNARINGATRSFSTADIQTINFNGQAGVDTFTYTSHAANIDVATFNTANVTIQNAAYTINLTNAEVHYLFGDATDSATFNDSTGSDQFYSLPEYSLMIGEGLVFYNQVIGFGPVIGNAVNGGTDLSFLYGNAGVQALTGTPTAMSLTGTGVSLTHNNFEQYYAFGLGGADTATLEGTSGNDVFYGLNTVCIFIGPGLFQYTVDFSNVVANASSGFDGALMYDSPGNDTFTGSPTTARMSGTGFGYTANAFDQVYAFGVFGGNDSATLDGSSQDDTYLGYETLSTLSRSGLYFLQTINFDTTHANLTSGGGNDIAQLFDSVLNDRLDASTNTATLTYASGVRNRVTAFDSVFANSIGGTNTRNVVNPLAFSLQFIGSWG